MTHRMNLKWIVQNNMRRGFNVDKMIDMLDAQGVSWDHIPYIHFDHSYVHNVSTEGITVFYGSTGLVRTVHESGKWNPGVFFDPERFAFTSLLNGFGDNLLNADSQVMTVREFFDRDYDPNKVLFARPNMDSKVFTGVTLPFEEFKEVWNYPLTSPSEGTRFSYDTEIQVAEPKQIIHEMRSFVVNGKVSTSSYYGSKMKEPVSPEDIDHAQEMAGLYQPAKVFTLDTCLLQDGSRKVVETNCFNSSGLYWTDVYKLVKDVNEFLLIDQEDTLSP